MREAKAELHNQIRVAVRSGALSQAEAAFTRSSAFAIIGSIDDYSTFRAPRFSEPVLRGQFGAFFVFQRTAGNLLQGQRGGWNIKKRGGGTPPHSLNSFVFLSLSPYSRLPDCR